MSFKMAGILAFRLAVRAHVPERQDAGHLERHLVRVDVVVGAVVQLHLEVHHRIPRHWAASRRLLDAALHRRDILARDHATDDLVHELEPRAARPWRDADPAVAALAAAAGLFLVLPLALSLPPDRLAIGDPRLRGNGLHAELSRHPAFDEPATPLAQPADHGRVQRRVSL